MSRVAEGYRKDRSAKLVSGFAERTASFRAMSSNRAVCITLSCAAINLLDDISLYITI
jgi:hypothetical protein